MVPAAKFSARSSKIEVKKASPSSSFRFIKASFSSKKVARQAPFLAGLHRATDGALTGLLIAVFLMSGFALHWRTLWIVAYKELEVTRDLLHRLSESTVIMERHFLNHSKRYMPMVPTRSKDLIYLDKNNYSTHQDSLDLGLVERINSSPSSHGY